MDRRRKLEWFSDKYINFVEECREKAGDICHFFAADSAGNTYYWFVVETMSFGYKTYRYYLGVKDEHDHERCNRLFWFSTNCDEGKAWMHPTFKTPQEARDYIKENDFIYKV